MTPADMHDRTTKTRDGRDEQEATAGASNSTDGHAEQEQRVEELMAADKQNLQDAFLNHVRKAKVPVTIFLINGVKLQGVITWFDNFCVLLRRDGQSQLVYKHAISTIMPGAPINLYEAED